MKTLLLNHIQQLLSQSHLLKKIIPFALAFGLIKVNSVAAVFIFSNLSASAAQYGLVDYALAIGLIACIPLNAGLPGSYPYFILKLKKRYFENAFYFHGLILSILFFAGIGVFYFTNIQLSQATQLTWLIGIIFSLQILAAVIHKSDERIYTALMFEGGFFVLLNLYNLYLVSQGSKVDLSELKILWTAYLLLLSGYYLYKFLTIGKFNWLHYKEIIKFGVPLIINSLLIIGLTGSARMLIEYFIDLKSVGIYGLYFRLSAIVMLLNQVFIIVFFKKIYISKPEQLDDWFQKFLIFIAFVSLLFTTIVPVFIVPYLKIIESSWAEFSVLYFLLNFQMFFWIILSLFEGITFRENLSGKCNPVFLFILLIMITCTGTLYYINILSLTNLVLTNILALYFAAEWQIYLLDKKALYFPKTKMLLRILSCLTIITFLIQI